MAKHTTRGVMRHVATDGSIAELEPFVEQLCLTAKGYADSDNAIEALEARRLLVDAAYYLVWNVREYIGNRHRAKRAKENMNGPNTIPSGESKPFPRYGEPGYERPEVILDTDTGLYDVVFYGCTTHCRLDVVGEREKIRAASVAGEATMDEESAAELRAEIDEAALPNGPAISADSPLTTIQRSAPTGGADR